MNAPAAPVQPVDPATESVAGEEDPGASLDLPEPTRPPPDAAVKPASAPGG